MKHYIHSYAVFMFFFLMSILCVAGVGENDWKLKNTLEKSANLKTGMSSAEIEAILGRPDNVDWEKNYAKENVSYRI